MSRWLRWVLVLALCTARGLVAQQQSEAALRERLVKRPLYLRGFWMGRALEFDGAGRLMGDPEKDGTVAGPLTLSGVDVTGVAVKGKLLTIHGDRVALVADELGRLQRLGVFSTTLIVPALVNKEYHAKEEVKITVHADEAGSFDAALNSVFVDGFVELAAVAPTYWQCYAAGYMAVAVSDNEAKMMVEACVKRLGAPDVGVDTPPQVLSRAELRWTRQAGQLGVTGESRVHFVVGPHGVPIRFQVVRAVGAGLDESVLKMVSESSYAPAMMGGMPIAAGLEQCFRFEARR